MAPARFFSRRAHAALCVLVLLLAALALSAQNAQPSSSDQTPQLNEDGSPKLDAAGNPITGPPPPPPPPPCVKSKGHKCPKVAKKKKEKPPKVTPAKISRGIFTVDGIIGKAALNYDIPDLRFIYFYAPGIGIVVVSDNRFAGAVEEKGAFNGHSLKVKVAGDHVMELYSDDILLGKKAVVGKGGKNNNKPESAYVVYNANFTLPSRFPIVGYGNKPDAPYAWPGSKLNMVTKGIAADAPAVPKVLTPKLAALPPCQADGKPAPVKGAVVAKSAVPTCVPPKPEEPHKPAALE